MKPLSARTRFVYLAVSVTAFLCTVPIAVFYASGYRFNGFSLVETGGIYVSVPISDASVVINGKEEGVSGLFTRSFYTDNLVEGAYIVQVSKDGYYPWVKKITVEPRIVTDVAAFLVPQSISIREIEIGDESQIASTTHAVSRNEYTALLKAFSNQATSSPLRDTDATSTPSATRGGTELYVENGNIVVRWIKDPRSTPSSFCLKPSACVQEFFLEKGKDTVTDARFFAGGVVYATKESGIFLAENDVRPIPLVVPLYSRPGAEFRIVSGSLIVKDGKVLYDISGF
ncbi:MAG: PEGA domain-containing protein [Patescibacteria group bacterium]